MNADFLEPDFLQIPFQLIKDKELQQVDRMLYGVIYWFEHLRDGRCYASNDKMALVLGTTARVVQNSLNNLEKLGYIERVFKDAAKRNRSEIHSLIAYKRLSPVRDRQKSNDPQVIEVSPTGDTPYHPQVTRERILKKKNHNPLGAEIIKAFEEIDPKNKRYYSNTTQRAACDFLIEEYGLEDVIKRVGVLQRTNKLSYFPTIVSPYELQEKWVKLQDAVDRKRGETSKKKPNVAFA